MRRRRRNSSGTNTTLIVVGGGIALYLLYRVAQSISAAQASVASAEGNVSNAAQLAGQTASAYQGYGAQLTSDANALTNAGVTAEQAAANAANTGASTAASWDTSTLWDQTTTAASDWWNS